jgi:hypothetical protein
MDPIVGVALSWAAVSAVSALIFALLSGRVGTAVFSALAGFVIGFVVNWLALYWLIPGLAGAWWGHGFMLASTALTIAIIGAINESWASNEGDDAGWSGIKMSIAAVVAALIMVFGSFSTYLINIFGEGNARRLAQLTPIELQDKSATLPDVSADHIEVVTQQMAYERARGAMANSTDTSLSTIFTTRYQDFTKTVYRGHFVWIAPITYSDSRKKALYKGGTVPVSPGYIIVSAEDTTEAPSINLEHQINFLPDGWFTQEVQRYMYTKGWTNGDIVDITLEPDDEGQPFYTAAFIGYDRVNTGQVIRRFLVLNATTGEIKDYPVTANTSAHGMERVQPETLVLERATQFGLWMQEGNGRSAKEWPNWSGAYQHKPAGANMVMLNNGTSIFLVPMTSNQEGDDSATGIMSFPTANNTAQFYPGARGFKLGGAVETAFKSPMAFRNFVVAQRELTIVYGRLTWVVSYGQQIGDVDENRQTFEGVGFLDAFNPDGANVCAARTMQEALACYRAYLARGRGNAQISQHSRQGLTVSGIVRRIGYNPATDSWDFQLDEFSNTFEAPVSTFLQLANAKVGDRLQLNYLNTGSDRVTVVENSLKNLTEQQEDARAKTLPR